MPGIVFEVVIVFAFVFGFGFYELYMLRRDRLRDEAKQAADSEQANENKKAQDDG